MLAGSLPAQQALFWQDRNLAATPVRGPVLAAVQRALAGPPAGMSTAIPTNTRLLDSSSRDGALTLVLSTDLLAAAATGDLENAIEQLSKTALTDPNVRTVHLQLQDAMGRRRDLTHWLQLAPLSNGPPPHPTTADLPPVTGALSGRTIAISPGHGYYWHSSLGWTTQRGSIDGLIEDIHTNEIAVQYLIPALENLGARVISCRERGQVPADAVADNDQGAPVYTETGVWFTSAASGYQGGTYRYASSASTPNATATWTFAVPRDGLFPVYVWFRAGSNRAADARFTIAHGGGVDAVTVDQTISDRTWECLGEFHFRAGTPAVITLHNDSAIAGRVVIADAVRLGGGLGSIARGSGPSNQARWRECARYWSQFAGAPSTVWDSIAGGEDNDDDVSARPRYAEWRGADAFLSLHTNAGGGAGTVTYIHDTQPTAGSAALAALVQNQLVADIRAEYEPAWVNRGLASANFGEVRHLSTMPGVLCELAFHDTPNSIDHRALHDPRFRHLAGRALARALMRHFQPLAPFAPEPPAALRVTQDGARGLLVAWDAVPGATSYSVERSPDGKGFTEAANVTATSWSTGPLPHHSTWSFRVRAWNASGRSFPTEVLSAGTDHLGAAQLLLVQGFDRLDRYVKGPENTRDYLARHADALRRDAAFSLGFDAASNEAVQLGRVALGSYRAVDWLLGEESTQHETFNAVEQQLVANYLQAGGNLLLSGAEIGWDLDAQGSAADRAFYRSRLGASYVADDAATYLLQAGIPGTLTAGLPAGRFDDGTFGTYDVDWPDVLAPSDALSQVCLRYQNGLAAAIQRDDGNARVVNFGFPFETVTDAALRAQLLQRAVEWLLEPMPLRAPWTAPLGQRLHLGIALPADAGHPYYCFVSDGIAPGIALPGGGILPLRPGPLLDASLLPNPWFGAFQGTLDAQGAAAPFVDVPAMPALAWLRVWFCAGTVHSPSLLVERTICNWRSVRLQ